MDHISIIFKKIIIKVYILWIEINSLHVIIPYVLTYIDSHFESL
jgi:hypothetical protein